MTPVIALYLQDTAGTSKGLPRDTAITANVFAAATPGNSMLLLWVWFCLAVCTYANGRVCTDPQSPACGNTQQCQVLVMVLFHLVFTSLFIIASIGLAPLCKQPVRIPSCVCQILRPTQGSG
jgi:hypothetical protein